MGRVPEGLNGPPEAAGRPGLGGRRHAVGAGRRPPSLGRLARSGANGGQALPPDRPAEAREAELVAAYLPLAYAAARDVYWPGADQDDVRQEALIALLDAARRWRPGGAPFGGFAYFVIKRQLASRLKIAYRKKHGPLNESSRTEWDLIGQDFNDLVENRERLRCVMEAIAELTGIEREALNCYLNGEEYSRRKDLDNALQRVRRKLRAVA